MATLTLSAPITRGASLLPDSTATIINFTSAGMLPTKHACALFMYLHLCAQNL